MRRALCLTLLALLLCIPATAHAEDPKNKGLYIDPVRQYVNVAAGDSKPESFTVANLTEQPMTITLEVQAFSVTDYAYDYEFSPPQNDWVKLGLSEVKLEPNQSKKIDYSIDVPNDTPSGGKYFTLLATTRHQNGSVDTVVRAASLAYLTILGPLNQDSQLKNDHLPRFVFGNEIPFSLDLQNTGNVHYFAHISANLSGMPSTSRSVLSASHLLMPGTARHLGGNIPAPFWPGPYRVNYGYKLDSGATVMRSHVIIYLPPWSLGLLAILVLLVMLVIRIFRHYRRKHLHHQQPDH